MNLMLLSDHETEVSSSNLSFASVLDDVKPLISALLCTRNRGDSLVPTVESILHDESIVCELIVIDQSTDQKTREALAPFLGDKRLIYIHSQTEGKGIALNLGLEMARGEIVAITDDDCFVPPAWPQYHYDAMLKHPDVVISYGNVVAVEHDKTAGFIPAYTVTKDRLCRNVWEKLPARGIGANTAVRRNAILELGGFDNEVGPGGKFRACIDRDMTLRCLLGGYSIYESKDSFVDHFGFRNWEQGRVLTYNAWYGMGASSVKPLKCGKWSPLLVALYEFTVFALLPFLFALITFKRRTGFLRIKGFIAGFIEGAKTPIDPVTLNYCQERGATHEAQIANATVSKAA